MILLEQNTQTTASLTSLDIHNKEFDNRLRGYDRFQVDEFLDKIYLDYEFFDKTIKKLKKENEELRSKQKLHENDLIDRIRDLEVAQWGRNKG